MKVNEEIGRNFGSHKGVRQGDPLSPFLFNIIVDGLDCMIKFSQEAGLISRIASDLRPREIAIYQYANDTIVFVKYDGDSARNMKLLLYLFEGITGLKINFYKSEVMIVMEDSDKCKFYVDMFNC